MKMDATGRNSHLAPCRPGHKLVLAFGLSWFRGYSLEYSFLSWFPFLGIASYVGGECAAEFEALAGRRRGGSCTI